MAPPLIKPRNIWLEQRVRELSRAITRQADTPEHAPDWNLVTQWADEMRGILCELRRLNGPGTRVSSVQEHFESWGREDVALGNCLDADMEAGMEESGQ